MRLYKRGEYWWCSFPWQGETLRRSTRCTTRTAALLTAQRWERERADPDHATAEAATFGGAVDGFLADLERSAKPASTKSFYRAKCGVLVRHFGAELPLNLGVTAPRVDKFMADRELEPVAFDAKGVATRTVTANTIHKELVALRQVLKRAKRRGEFRRDVSEVLPIGFSPKYVPRMTALTLEEAAKLCAALPPSRAAAVAFALATTARHAEVFRARTLDVVGTNVDLRGTKTAGSERTVSVAPFARPLLAFALKHGGGRDGLMFKPWPNARRGLERACKRVGCSRVTWNDLRRTLSTWLVEGGVSDTVIAKMLGHVDTTMLHRVYGKPKHAPMAALLESQSAGIPAVDLGGSGERLVYVGPASKELPQHAAEPEDASKQDENGGPTGTRTRDLRIKSPVIRIDSDSVSIDVSAFDSADSAQAVRAVDVQEEGEEPPSPRPPFPWLLHACRGALAALHGGRVPASIEVSP